jgi:hypothetical protein
MSSIIYCEVALSCLHVLHARKGRNEVTWFWKTALHNVTFPDFFVQISLPLHSRMPLTNLERLSSEVVVSLSRSPRSM